MDMDKDNKNGFIFLLFLFFLIVYGISIAGINLRYLILILCFFIVCLRFRNFLLNKHSMKLAVFFIGYSIYALLISVIYSTGEHFESFRLLRCVATLLLISAIIQQFKISSKKMFCIVKILLILHAISILVGIIWPPFKEIIQPISQYTKAFTNIRSTGLMNGEDGAGFFCNCGLIMETVERIQKKETVLSKVNILFLVSTVFTSRFALMFTAIILITAIYVLIKKGDLKHATSIIIVLVPMAIIGVLLWILTTGVAMEFRQKLLYKYPLLQGYYDDITSSFVDYGKYTTIIGRHTSIGDLSLFDALFGVGHRLDVSKDVGYIKTMYSIGVIGIVGQIIFYIRSIKMVKASIDGENNNDYTIQAYIFIVVLIFAWEAKNSFVFSTGYFEILTSLYFSIVFNAELKKEVACKKVNSVNY